MSHTFTGFKPEGKWSKFATSKLRPLMYWLQGTWSEEPQSTHFWNNIKYKRQVTFSALKSVFVTGDYHAVRRRWFGFLPIFHMPRFGGWRRYVVLEPSIEIGEWFIGWDCADAFDISQIPIHGQVRALIGFGPAYFFGINRDGVQIKIVEIGRGIIGDGGRFKNLPLR